jgi:nickel-dependent lactate racemase
LGQKGDLGSLQGAAGNSRGESLERTRTIALPFGSDRVEAVLPAASLCFEARRLEAGGSPSVGEALQAALAGPIGCPPLEELAKGGRRAVVLVDDVTRPTPAQDLVPELLERLGQAGIHRGAVTIVVATGTHRAMRPDEVDAKVGHEVRQTYDVVSHDYRDQRGLVLLGRTAKGTRVSVNRLVAEAELVIGVGNIVPHRYCGWAGGAKIVQPGVCGEDTTAATHLMMTEDPGVRLGVVENSVRHEMEAVADRVNLRFVVNTILDNRGRVQRIVAGNPRKAFRVGVEAARRTYTVAIPGRADVVIASASPSDTDFWQAGKALYSADLAVREGGIIILVSPCYEGVGEHEEFAGLSMLPPDTIRSRVRANMVQDRISAAAALAVAEVRSRAEVWIVTRDLSDGDAEVLGIRRFTSLQEAVEGALHRMGKGPKFGVLHEATEVVPIMETEEYQGAQVHHAS